MATAELETVITLIREADEQHRAFIVYIELPNKQMQTVASNNKIEFVMAVLAEMKKRLGKTLRNFYGIVPGDLEDDENPVEG